MIEIKEEQVGINLPLNEIGMVIMQPFVELCHDHGLYRWSDKKKKKQIERIIRTIEIAKKAEHGCEKTHFTIFPEYSIPGLEGIQKIEENIRSNSWKEGTFIIGGVDGLTKSEYYALCQGINTVVHQNNRPEKVRNRQMINCCITLVKTINEKGDVIIRKWIQPKLCPSWQEENNISHDMFEGKCVYVFEVSIVNGGVFRFMSLVCYNWIGPLGSASGIFTILQKMNALPGAKPYGKPIHLILVLQNNEEPNHPSFLNNVYRFFNDKYPFVIRDKSIVALVNNAGDSYPGPCKKYGYSSLVFSPNSTYITDGSPPSYAVVTKILRGNEILQTCKEALFRENGGCIHSFRLFHPQFIDRTPESRRRPLRPVLVYALDEKIKDPRTSGEQVPAVVKWINDKIDLIDLLPFFHQCTGQLSNLIEKTLDKVIKEIKWRDEQFLTKMMVFATADMTEEKQKNVDIWAEKENRSLETVIYSLVMSSCSNVVIIRNAPGHACIKQKKYGSVIDIVVVSGGVTHEQNIAHAKKCCPGRKERTILIISRDQNDNPLTDRDKPIHEIETNIKYCGFYNLRGCLTSSTLEEIREKILRSMGIYNE